MNYIKQLQDKYVKQRKIIGNAEDEIYSFMFHLRSDKFTGLDLDGSRKDWISIKDVETRLQIILNKLNDLD